MAAHTATIISPSYNSSNAAIIKWSSFDSGANNVAIDVDGKDASKILILIAANTTLNNKWWVGTSDSRSSHTSMAYPYSAAGLGRMKIQTTLVVDGQAQSKFLSTVAADTEVFGIFALGPFETARFKDSNGQINVARGVLTAGAASHSSDEHFVSAILIP